MASIRCHPEETIASESMVGLKRANLVILSTSGANGSFFLKKMKKVNWLLKCTAKKRKTNIWPFLAGPLPIRPPANPNVVPLNGQVWKLYRKLFICSGRELITEPSDLPNPLEWSTTARGGAAAL